MDRDDERRPDDCRPGDVPDLPPLPPGVVVPDDASALAADREAWLRELAAAGAAGARPGLMSMRRRGPRGGPLGRWAGRWAAHLPGGALGAVLAVMLAGVAAASSLLVVLVPRAGVRPAAALPLAAGPAVRTAGVGEPGGLLPDTELRPVAGAATSVRQVRPALLAVVTSCASTACAATPCPSADHACRALLDDAALQAAQAGVRLWLVGPQPQVPALVALARTVGNGSAGVLEDVDGALAGALRARGTTFVLVHADGVVAQVVRDAAEPLPLAPAITSLPAPGAAPVLRSSNGPPAAAPAGSPAAGR